MATDCTRPRTTRCGSGRGQRGSARSAKKENIALFMRCAPDEPNIALFMVLPSVGRAGEGSRNADEDVRAPSGSPPRSARPRRAPNASIRTLTDGASWMTVRHGHVIEGLSTLCPPRLLESGTGAMDKAWITPPAPCHARTWVVGHHIVAGRAFPCASKHGPIQGVVRPDRLRTEHRPFHAPRAERPGASPTAVGPGRSKPSGVPALKRAMFC